MSLELKNTLEQLTEIFRYILKIYLIKRVGLIGTMPLKMEGIKYYYFVLIELSFL